MDLSSIFSTAPKSEYSYNSKVVTRASLNLSNVVKFMFSKKATKIEDVVTVNLTLCSKCQIAGEDFVSFCGLLRKHELYLTPGSTTTFMVHELCK